MAPAASTAAMTSASRIGPAGLGNGRDAGLEAGLDGVGEREERVGAAGGAAERVLAGEAAGLLDRLAGGVDPGHLAGAHPDQRAVLDEDDRVGRDPPGEAPGEVEVGALAVGRARGGWRRVQADGSSGIDVRRRDQDGAPGGPEARAGRGGGRRDGAGEVRVDDEPEVRLRREDLAGPGVEAGRDDDLEEDRGEALGDRAIHLARQRHDPAERGDRVAGQRGLPRGEERRALGGAARIGVLDDDAGRAAELARDGGGRGGVEDVVVRQRLALERRLARRERSGLGVRSRAPVAGSRLVGILAVAERLDLLEADGERRRIRVGGARQAGPVGQVHAGRRPSGPGARRRSGRRRRPCAGTPRPRGRREGRPGAAPRPPSGEPRGPRRSGPATSRSRRWRGSWPPPGPSTARRCRSPR